jgi:hypothetical protein
MVWITEYAENRGKRGRGIRAIREIRGTGFSHELGEWNEQETLSLNS